MYLFILFICACSFLCIGFWMGIRFSSKEIIKAQNFAYKHLELLKIAVKWIKEPFKIKEYIFSKGYKKIAVYGMSYLGDCLVNTMKKEGLNVICGIDKNYDKLFNPTIPIIDINSTFLPEFDVIIITAITSYQQIRKELEEKLDTEIKIISLEEILYN